MFKKLLWVLCQKAYWTDQLQEILIGESKYLLMDGKIKESMYGLKLL